jgi:hypothetical protein
MPRPQSCVHKYKHRNGTWKQNNHPPPATTTKKWEGENIMRNINFFVTQWWITLWYGTHVPNVWTDVYHLAVTSAGLTKLIMQHLNKFSPEFWYHISIFLSDYLKTWHNPSLCHPFYPTVCALLPQTALVGHQALWTVVVPCLSENIHT